MFYVYLLSSIEHSEKLYVGYTSDLKRRFKEHNTGSYRHTSKYKPWKITVYLGFADEAAALAFEKYLKTGSGRAFIKNKLLRSL
jgi:putative endonuclease